MKKKIIFNSFYTGIYRGLILSLLIFIILMILYFSLPQQYKDYIFVKENAEQKVLIGGNFELIGKKGQIYTNTSFLGKPLLVFFGFTFCPDICPYGLATIGDVLDYMGKDVDKINSVFITLDPERDNFTRTSAFVENFHSNIIGLSGSEENIRKVADSWKVYNKKVYLEGSELDYTIDHSSYIYLMDKSGNYVTHFSHTSDPMDITKKIKSLF